MLPAYADPETITVTAPETNSPSGVAVMPKFNTQSTLSLPVEPLPTSASPQTGLFPSLGNALLDDGVDIHGIIIDHFLANPTAGFVRGNTSNFGAIIPALDIDLGKLIGLQGGNVHFQLAIWPFRSDYNSIVLQTGGTLTGYQTLPEPIGKELSVLTYQQKLVNDRLSIEFGRTNVYHYFFIPNGLDPFTYESTTLYVDGDLVPPPHADWGAVGTYHLTPKWFLQGGAFEDDYRRAIYNGFNFGTPEVSGAQILGEIDYRSEFNNSRYPTNLEFGIEYNTRTGTTNFKGTAASYSPRLVAANYPGGGVIYAQGAQVVWRGRSRDHAPPANIEYYGSFDVAVEKPQPMDLDALAGVDFTGLLPGRPADALGLEVHYQRLSKVEASFETRNETLASGPGPRQARNGFAFEIVNKIQLTPWATLDPYLQYFVDPDAYYDSFQTPRQPDGFIAGAFATISLGPLLGTSLKPF